MGDDNIFGMGGNDVITLNHNAAGTNQNTVWLNFYGEQAVGAGAPTTFVQAITDIVGGVETFVNGYGADTTTIHKFALGPTGDTVNIGFAGWAHSVGGLIGGGTAFGLEVADGSAFVGAGAATLGSVVTLPGTNPGPVSVTLDGISTFANAGQLQTSLTTTGDILFNGGATLIPHSVFDVLVAYGTGTGVDIADVKLFNQTAAAQVVNTNNPNITVTAHDLVDLVGTTSLGTLNAHNIFFHA